MTTRGFNLNLEDDEPRDRLTVSKLPYNYTFGPIYSVAIRRYKGIWQVIVEVETIYVLHAGSRPFLVWVPISQGVTQWARWTKNTGDPAAKNIKLETFESEDAKGDQRMYSIDVKDRT